MGLPLVYYIQNCFRISVLVRLKAPESLLLSPSCLSGCKFCFSTKNVFFKMSIFMSVQEIIPIMGLNDKLLVPKLIYRLLVPRFPCGTKVLPSRIFSTISPFKKEG